jgi:hypothetical protein
MRWPRALLAALAACSTLASCASSRPPALALPLPLPAELAQRCPPPAEPKGPRADDVVLALKQLYDQYALCAGRHADLLRWLNDHESTRLEGAHP